MKSTNKRHYLSNRTPRLYPGTWIQTEYNLGSPLSFIIHSKLPSRDLYILLFFITHDIHPEDDSCYVADMLQELKQMVWLKPRSLFCAWFQVSKYYWTEVW